MDITSRIALNGLPGKNRTKKFIGCAYGLHSINSYIFISTFLLHLLVNQYRSARLSSVSAVRWESLSRGDAVWNQVMVSLSNHSACKTSIIGESGRWSSTSIQTSTTVPRDLCGEDLIWWWAWGTLLPLVERRLKGRKRAMDACPVSGKHWEKFHGREQCHRNKQGEWWEKGVGEQQDGLMTSCLDFRRAACFRDVSHLIAESCHLAGNPGLECWGAI